MASIADLFLKVVAEMSGFEAEVVKGAEKAGDKAAGSMSQRIGAGLKKNAGKLALGGLAAGLGIATKGMLELEDATAQFRAETGATAEEAEQAGKAINAMAGSNLQPIAEIGEALTKVHTDLGLTGEAAERTTGQFLKFATATGQDAAGAVLAFDDILDNWSLTADDAQGVMDKLIVSHQKFGGSIEENEKTLAALAPSMRAANFEIDDAIGLLNLFGAKGLDANTASAAFSKSLTKVKSPDELRELIDDITKTEDPFLRAEKAAKLFGARAGAKLANALDGVNLDDYTVSMDEAAGATEDAAGAIEGTFGNRFKLLMKEATAALTGFGSNFGPALTGLASLASLGGALGGGKLLSGLAGPIKKLGVGIATKLGAALAGEAAVSAVSQGIGQSVAKAGASSVVSGAMSKIGGVLGSSLGMGLGVAAAAVAIVILAQELDKQVKANEAKLKAIGEGVTKQVTSGTTAELEKSKGALEAGLKKLDGVWDAGFHTGKARANLQKDLAAINAELESRAADAGERVRGAFVAAEPKVTEGAEKALSGVPNVVARSAEQAGNAAKLLPREIAEGIKSGRDLVSGALSVLRDALKNEMSPAKERAQLLGELVSEELVKGMKSKDPIVRQAAIDARDTILKRLEELPVKNGKLGKKSMEELAAALKSKDPVIRAAAEKINATLIKPIGKGAKKKAHQAGDDIKEGLKDKKHGIGVVAFNLGTSIGAQLIRGLRIKAGKGQTATDHYSGGPVTAGQMISVGEHGREMFVPTTNGVILTNAETKAGVGSGDVNYNTAIHVDGVLPVRTARDLIGTMIRAGEIGALPGRRVALYPEA